MCEQKHAEVLFRFEMLIWYPDNFLVYFVYYHEEL